MEEVGHGREAQAVGGHGAAAGPQAVREGLGGEGGGVWVWVGGAQQRLH